MRKISKYEHDLLACIIDTKSINEMLPGIRDVELNVEDDTIGVTLDPESVPEFRRVIWENYVTIWWEKLHKKRDGFRKAYYYTMWLFNAEKIAKCSRLEF